MTDPRQLADRRDFLLSSLGLVGAGPLLGSAAKARTAQETQASTLWQRPPPLAERPRKIRYALKWGMVGTGGSVLEKFRLLKQLGYDGVELDSPSDIDLDEVLAAKAETGLETAGLVGSQHWGLPLSARDPAVRAAGRQALEQGLRDAHKLGASTLLVVPAVVDQEVGYEQAWERSQAELARLLPLCAELGVQLALENVWNNFLLSPLEARAFVDRFESPWIGWHFDVGNAVHYGWPEQWIEILGPRLLKLDVKGYSRRLCNDQGLWRGFEAPIGEDDCGWERVGRALDAIGFEDLAGGAWAAAEVGGGDETRLAEVLARMHRALQAGR